MEKICFDKISVTAHDGGIVEFVDCCMIMRPYYECEDEWLCWLFEAEAAVAETLPHNAT